MSQKSTHSHSVSATHVSRSSVFTVVPALSLVTVCLLGACEVSIRIGGKGPGAADGGFGGNDGGPGGDPGIPVGASGGSPFISDGGAGGQPGSTDGPTRPIGPPPLHAPLTSASKVDLLFLIDDSNSMAPLQAKLRARMPDFMNVLKNAPGGMPDVHVAVVSSSLGAGIFGNVTGCLPNTAGSLDGKFQHKAGCGLHPGQTFLKSTGGATPMNNFDGDIADVFSCIADLGQNGCGFEHQLESVRLALQWAQTSVGENGGFLRPDALLAVVFLTNEDDCSVFGDSRLFDPNEQSVGDRLGGLQSYRCNEFGHICDQEMPHTGPSTPMTMTNCRSREDGMLIQTNGFIEFLYSLKPGAPQNVFLALIAGPTAPYVVQSRQFTLGNGGTEVQPTVAHSCTGGVAASEYADPAVRLGEVAEAFSPNSIVASICADDFASTLTDIAEQMVGQ
jgi:hypothetical protein